VTKENLASMLFFSDNKTTMAEIENLTPIDVIRINIIKRSVFLNWDKFETAKNKPLRF